MSRSLSAYVRSIIDGGTLGSPEKSNQQLNTLQSESEVKIGVIEALNGKIIEISTYKSNPNGPDWTHQAYIVRDGETLAEAMATVIIMKGLER
jgi:hypothetical protein